MSGVYRLNRTNNVVGRLNKLFEVAAADYWWLAGGISAANCIAAYQPIGAADYAASKVNLANPGTYDATEGVAPDWDDVNGWKFNGIDDYLNTGVTPEKDQTWSMIIKYSNWVWKQNFNTFCGCGGGAGHGFLISEFDPNSPYEGQDAYFFNGNYKYEASGAGAAEQVRCIAGQYGYIDGVKVTTAISNNTSDWDFEIYIGAQNDSGVAVTFNKNYTKLLAIYDIALIEDQVLALTTTMNAL